MQSEAIGKSRRDRLTVFATVIAVVATCGAAAAQWPDYPSPKIPRTTGGRPDLSAPAPRTSDGKPDLSGIWLSERDPAGVAGGIEGTWLGYSIGRWEGDTLVVHTAGFNDKTWLDGSGHPHSEDMRVVERFRRRDVGHMDIQITIDDPKAYTKPLAYTQRQELVPDTDLIEYICNENYQKPLKALVGK